MISIVGFGRPKFKGAGTAKPASSAAGASQVEESSDVKDAIALLKSKGYTVTK
jgi:hypothetical protein